MQCWRNYYVIENVVFTVYELKKPLMFYIITSRNSNARLQFLVGNIKRVMRNWYYIDCPRHHCTMWNTAHSAHCVTVRIGDTFMIPSFSDRSYIQLRRLEHGYREIWIEMTFRSLEPDGLLLYTGQTNDGVGDFMALVVNAQYIEFR